uniref:Ig-like domain-containing protein n=1 Tax=Oryctolagus cuniculus TaxID=9986 RepID=A0A5F9DSK0_RABIT
RGKPLTGSSPPGLCAGPRTRVQAGERAPVPPGSVITLGRPGTLWCQGTLEAQECRLYREGIPEPWDRAMPLEPGNKVKFSIPLMAEVYAGRYSCVCLSTAGWSEPSDALELRVSAYGKPSLSALPSPVVTSGGNVTLQCRSQLGFHRFILTEEGAPWAARTWSSEPRPSAQSQALFPVGPVTPGRRWAFRCYGSYRENPSVWSEPSDPSDPLTLVVHWFASPAGMFPAPSLSAQPSPVVASGENVSLSCGSDEAGTAHLLKEGGAGPLHSLEARYSHGAGLWQVTFLLGPVDSTQRGIYRCYHADTNKTHVWSLPSDPLQLEVSGEGPALSHQSSWSVQAPAPQDHTLENLIRIGMAGLVLLGLGLLLAEAWYSQRRNRAAGRW